MFDILWKLALIAFIGFNILTRGKFLISLYLIIRDFIKMDKRQFRGFGFWLYCGLGGSGKTLSMVEYLERVRIRYPKLKIYTNFNYINAHGQINGWEDILNLENFELVEIDKSEYDGMVKRNELSEAIVDGDKYFKKQHNGIIFGFDEIHLTFASQNWENCPDNMLEYVSQQRKLHKQIVASAQVFTRVDIKLREQTNYVVECKSLGGRWIFNRFFHTQEYLANGDKGDKGMQKRRRSKRYSFVAYDSIRQLYDTMQVMCDLRDGKSNKSKQRDKLRQELISFDLL